MNLSWKGSPNFTAGRGGKKIEFIVIHWIVGTLESANTVFQKSERQASAHYGIGQSKIYQWVAEENTAWHCGVFDANQRSIGIEHEGGPSLPVTDAVYSNSAELIATLWRKYGRIPLRKHSEFKATQCPGTIDLNRLAVMAEAILNPPPTDPCLTVKNQLQIANNSITSLNTTITQKDAEIANLTVKLQQADDEIAELMDEVSEIELENLSHQREIEQLKTQSIEAIRPVELMALGLKKFFRSLRNA